MASINVLSSIKAFAEINGFKLHRGIGYHAHSYQLLKEIGDKFFPICQYMEPDMLMTWIDGFEIGRKEQTPIIPLRGRKKR